MSRRDYQICIRCVMDTSDPKITFGDGGQCNHCTSAIEIKDRTWFPNDVGEKLLGDIVKKIKEDGKKREYDCVIGLSGGADSSYLICKVVKDYGLNPLAVHVDGGWNSELAVNNIENIVKKLKIDLFTHVVDWEEMKDLQVAFLKAGVANQDTPQDHAIYAAVYNFAVKNNIKYMLSGSNFATESILPISWGYDAADLKHLKAIHKLFGKIKLKNYPRVNFFEQHFKYKYINKFEVISPLNYMRYEKNDAINYLEKNFGWRNYGGKHHESIFTKYFQSYYLPEMFGYDKRRAHLSSLIVSGQISRDSALEELAKPLYDEIQMKEDQGYIARKLSLTGEEFRGIIEAPKHLYSEYPNNESLLPVKDKIFRILSVVKRYLMGAGK